MSPQQSRRNFISGMLGSLLTLTLIGTDLLKAISFESLAARAALPADHESTTRIYFYKKEGLPDPLHFTAYLFALKKGVSVVPHGHHNMVTMHMMLKGLAHARHFTRRDHLPMWLRTLAWNQPNACSTRPAVR